MPIDISQPPGQFRFINELAPIAESTPITQTDHISITGEGLKPFRGLKDVQIEVSPDGTINASGNTTDTISSFTIDPTTGIFETMSISATGESLPISPGVMLVMETDVDNQIRASLSISTPNGIETVDIANLSGRIVDVDYDPVSKLVVMSRVDTNGNPTFDVINLSDQSEPKYHPVTGLMDQGEYTLGYPAVTTQHKDGEPPTTYLVYGVGAANTQASGEKAAQNPDTRDFIRMREEGKSIDPKTVYYGNGHVAVWDSASRTFKTVIDESNYPGGINWFSMGAGFKTVTQSGVEAYLPVFQPGDTVPDFIQVAFNEDSTTNVEGITHDGKGSFFITTSHMVRQADKTYKVVLNLTKVTGDGRSEPTVGDPLIIGEILEATIYDLSFEVTGDPDGPTIYAWRTDSEWNQTPAALFTPIGKGRGSAVYLPLVSSLEGQLKTSNNK